MSARTAAVLLAATAACQLPVQPHRSLAPLTDEGEVYLYLEPLPPEASRLSFTLESIAALRSDGGAVPLERALRDVSAKDVARQRLLGWGRLPPGDYTGLAVRVSRATLATDRGPVDLLVAPEPLHVTLPLGVARGRATLLSLTLSYSRSVGESYAFTPAFAAATPTTAITDLAAYCSVPSLAHLAVVDGHRRRATGVLPVGREPQGIALDRARGRAWVALAGEDRLELVDLVTGADLGRVPLRGGDRPRELALAPDGRVLLSVNAGTDSVAFVDPGSSAEVGRVAVGEEPWSILLDRAGQRAYVLNRRSNSISAIDLAGRAVAATAPTDPEPLRARFDRAGKRLYVIHGGSAYMSVFSLPDLTLLRRTFVGLGADALEVDARTDLIYLGRRDETGVQIFDPFSFMPVDFIDLPDTVSALALDGGEGALLALLPGLRSVAIVDLATRRVADLVELAGEPFGLAAVRGRD